MLFTEDPCGMRATLNGGSTLPGAVLSQEGKEKIYIPPTYTPGLVTQAPQALPSLNNCLFQEKCEGWFFFLCNSEMMRNHRTTVNKIHCLPGTCSGMVTPGSSLRAGLGLAGSAPSQGPPRPRAQSGLSWMFGGWVDGQHAYL